MGVKKAGSGTKSQPKLKSKKTTKTDKPDNGNKQTKQTDTTKQTTQTKDANNHNMTTDKNLSAREKEIQASLERDENGNITNYDIDFKSGDKIGNVARAMADKDSNGELSDEELGTLHEHTKALLDKNPELAALAEKNNLDPYDSNDLESLMKLDIEESGMKPGEDKIKIPTDEDVEKAKEDIEKANEELGEPEDVKVDSCSSNCNNPHEDDIIKQIADLVKAGDEAMGKEEFDEAISKFSEAISLGKQALSEELGGKNGSQKAHDGAILDPINKDSLNQKAGVNDQQRYSGMMQMAKQDTSGVIKEAMAKDKAGDSPRISKILDLMAYAQKGIMQAKQKGGKGGTPAENKNQTGDANADNNKTKIGEAGTDENKTQPVQTNPFDANKTPKATTPQPLTA